MDFPRKWIAVCEDGPKRLMSATHQTCLAIFWGHFPRSLRFLRQNDQTLEELPVVHLSNYDPVDFLHNRRQVSDFFTRGGRKGGYGSCLLLRFLEFFLDLCQSEVEILYNCFFHSNIWIFYGTCWLEKLFLLGIPFWWLLGCPGKLVNCSQMGYKLINGVPSLKLTWHLKMDGWNISFRLGWPIFRCELLVSGSVYWDYNPFTYHWS